MGVPKFYRWISERYPCLSEVIKEFQIPEFDNLYLDMNGIIHVCSHPEDDNPHFRITEQKIFSDIFYYIEFLFRMIKPKKVFFMAIDGVAPRAKMNQQRGRRFRSAKDAEMLEKKAKDRGETLPTEKRFDSNCITPGTPFMARLDDALQVFAMRKVSTDPIWQGVRVYLSGHSTPGEGEHKIMDFIRYEKSHPAYDPNTRHCLYGLDADLIMLGLITHEPHLSLLREEVRFGGKKDQQKRPATPEETTFHLLHLSLMREYLYYEFISLKDNMDFAYDLEKIIDDWVLIGFLVGNDFIPHLPHFHIHHDALPYLWAAYKSVMLRLDGYMNEDGHLNLRRFEVFLKEVAKMDTDKFNEQFVNEKWLEGKKGSNTRDVRLKERHRKKEGDRKKERDRKKVGVKTMNQFAVLPDNSSGDDDALEVTSDPITPADIPDEVNSESPDDVPDPVDERMSSSDSNRTDDAFDSLNKQFIHIKSEYYTEKLGYHATTRAVLREQTECYITGIQWILLYYYEGVPSWSWFYPHHYAPYVSDVTSFANLSFEYDKSYPLLPFEQLMGVLPSASCDFLPLALQNLMLSSTSPVTDFYPSEFRTDLNGKQQDWEAVVLIPFIEEERLLGTMRPLYSTLTDEEKSRNQHGPHYLFTSSTAAQPCDVDTESMPLPFVNTAKCTRVQMFQFAISPCSMRKGKIPGCHDDVYYPGFPTLIHIPHKAVLKKAAVKVFQHNSRGDSMVLQITDFSIRDVEAVASDLIGQCVYVGWPHLHEAKVIRVSDDERKFELGEITRKPYTLVNPGTMSESEGYIWRQEVQSINDRYEGRLGVEIGPTNILVHALPMTGRKYVCTAQGRVNLDIQWCNLPVAFALHTTVKDIKVKDPTMQLFHSIEDLFPLQGTVFMLGWPNYGCQGQVLEADAKNEGRVKICVSVPNEPIVSRIKDKQFSTQYHEGYVVAQMLSISSHLVSRITGTMLVARGNSDRRDDNLNIGLNLKFNRKNAEVPGYTKKVHEIWTYSDKAVGAINDYLEKFEDMWWYISTNNRLTTDVFSVDALFPGETEKLLEVENYLKQLPCRNITPVAVGTEFVDEVALTELIKEVDKVKRHNNSVRSMKMQVKAHHLYRPLPSSGQLVPDSTSEYQLFDRVVAVRDGHSVPIGLRGTVTRIQVAEKETDVMYEVLFDAQFEAGIAIGEVKKRGYRCFASSLINLSHGDRKNSTSRVHSNIASNSPSNALSNAASHGRGTKTYSKAVEQTRSSNLWAANADSSPGKTSRYAKSSLNDTGSSEATPPAYSRVDSQSRRNTNSQPQAVDVLNQARLFKKSSQQAAPNDKPTAHSTPNPKHHPHTTPAQDPGPPFYMTPVMSRPVPQTGSEFAQIWQQLQIKSPANVPNAPRQSDNANTVGTDVLTSLSKAAMSLPIDQPATRMPENDASPHNSANLSFISLGNTSVDDQSRVGPSEKPTNRASEQSGTNHTVDMVPFKLTSKSQDDISTALSAMSSTETHHDNIASRLKALSMTNDSPVSNAEHDTNTLKTLLKIGTGTPETSAPSHTRDMSPVASYGRQFSVKELFDVAKKAESSVPSSLKEPPKGTAPGPHPKMDRVKQQSEPHFSMQQHTNASQGNTKYVSELKATCLSLQMGEPRFDYSHISKDKIMCCITLGNWRKMNGSVCRTREEAAESAASMALLQIKKSQQPTGVPNNRVQFSVPPPGFTLNSAFRPVWQTDQAVWTAGAPLHLNMPPSMFAPQPYVSWPMPLMQGFAAPPMMHPALLQPQQFTGGQQFLPRVEHTWARVGGVGAPTATPFIPLQVARQTSMSKKSPERPQQSNREPAEHSTGNEASIAMLESVVESQPIPVTPQASPMTHTDQSHSVGNFRGKKQVMNRSKSRLAANFNSK